MNPGFKTKFNEMRQNSPVSQEGDAAQAKAYDDHYGDVGHMRNLCFVWQDGRRMFLSYSYLISGEYTPEENVIRLHFSTHQVQLKGVNLEGLFYDVMQQITRQIVCTDPRYNIIDQDHKFIVNDIIVSENN